jgi:hypothetical protein
MNTDTGGINVAVSISIVCLKFAAIKKMLASSMKNKLRKEYIVDDLAVVIINGESGSK